MNFLFSYPRSHKMYVVSGNVLYTWSSGKKPPVRRQLFQYSPIKVKQDAIIKILKSSNAYVLKSTLRHKLRGISIENSKKNRSFICIRN